MLRPIFSRRRALLGKLCHIAERLLIAAYHEAAVESFRRDPTFAAAYLNAVLEDGDRAEFMSALRYVTEALGGVSAVAQKTGLNATTLYRTLSPRGNPELKSFMDIMKVVGMRILVEPTPARRSASRPRRPERQLVARRRRQLHSKF